MEKIKLQSNFYATRHAIERMQARFNCREDKIGKIIVKAWKSKEKINNKLFRRLMEKKFVKYRNNRMAYKYFNGYIFVFDTRYKNKKCQKKLLTVYNPKVDY